MSTVGRLLPVLLGMMPVLLCLMPILAAQLLTPAQVAAEIGKSKTTVTTWCEQGILPAVRINSRWYLKRPELVRDGWLPSDNDEAAATGKVAAANREG